MQQAKAKLAKAYRATHDIFFGIKDVFEGHRVAFTIGASVLSAGAAWAGYVGRQVHQQKVEERLNSIEESMKSVHNLEETQVKALTNPGISFKACFASTGTALIIGYGLGWRGGRRFATKRFQRQQQKLLTPKKSVSSLMRPFTSSKFNEWRKTALRFEKLKKRLSASSKPAVQEST
ncbi:hypothetical protein O6H91_03G082300 [Diphasiastrum complanatum]|uniref:Uncharacterized protein n=1 Tax=Diphasiastrum complanatum TaxID=34168 RepID=A0ACC2E8C1_DIPCM|nr:hypothetical protein O6H91_03G082300 [Diphasiastrum complanatum]